MYKQTSFKPGEEGRGILKGILTFFIACGLLLLLGALFITWKDVNETVRTIITCFITGIASWLGGWVGGKTAKKFGLKIGATIGGVDALCVLSAGAIVNGLNFTFLSLIKLFLCILFGSLGGIMGSNLSMKRKFKI